MPVFVPTHRPHDVRVAGATTFTFVTDVETAIARAKAVAGEKNVPEHHPPADPRPAPRRRPGRVAAAQVLTLESGVNILVEI